MPIAMPVRTDRRSRMRDIGSTPGGRGTRTGTSTPAPCTAGRIYDLLPVLRWFAAHIGIHHVHHLSSRIIPCYRPGEALRDHSELQGVSRLTLTESVRCRRLALWDEDQRIAASWLMQISAAERWLR